MSVILGTRFDSGLPPLTRRSDMTKDYLGDSVYADFDGYHVILTTENGHPDDPRNRIFLEPSVISGLQEYAKRARAEYKRNREED